MRYALIIIFATLILPSCSNNEEPTPEVFCQLAEISNGESESQTFFYDDDGRIIRYVAAFPDETINVAYTYVSDNLIKIHTERMAHSMDGDNAISLYEDDLHLENGRAKYCDGIYSTNQFGKGLSYQKKYRHEFSYTADNHLNIIKNTEWNKNGDSWAEDKPWSWEDYYIWENSNLVTVEDCDGNQTPKYIYKYSYSSISGVRNVLPLHWNRFQYFPLQLKGYFGSEPTNLIMGLETILPDGRNTKITYQYNIEDNKITDYTKTQNGISDRYFVTWVE